MCMLTTLTRPTAGEARIAGVDVRARERVIEHAGYLPDEPPLFEELTGREQMCHVAALHDVPREVAAERIQRYLDRFDLVDAADRRIDGYSTGIRKKIGLMGDLARLLGAVSGRADARALSAGRPDGEEHHRGVRWR